MPYNNSELIELAKHCTEKEDDANKVDDRLPNQRQPCCFLRELEPGSTQFAPVRPIKEPGAHLSTTHRGKIGSRVPGRDVGNRLKVELIRVDIDKGLSILKRSSGIIKNRKGHRMPSVLAAEKPFYL